ncbi:MAG TPA: GntR family transcriptional regulator [Ktedonobacteraceae bacterium]|nr:GntR family transcriptional regulator [Ktedonobacteraceae bacterium]
MSPDTKVNDITDALRKRILAGEFGTGGRLPSLRMFAQQYDTSQQTMNTVVQRLQSEGILSSLGRRGIFVRMPRTRIPGIVPRFDLHIKELGMEPVEANTVTPEIISATEDVAKALSVMEGASVVHRMRRQGTTVSHMRLAENFYPVTLVDNDILEQMQQNENFDVLLAIKNKHGKIVKHIQETVIARFPLEAEQELLKINRNTPVLDVRRINSDGNGARIMYNRITFVASYFELTYDYDVTHWEN